MGMMPQPWRSRGASRLPTCAPSRPACGSLREASGLFPMSPALRAPRASVFPRQKVTHSVPVARLPQRSATPSAIRSVTMLREGFASPRSTCPLCLCPAPAAPRLPQTTGLEGRKILWGPQVFSNKESKELLDGFPPSWISPSLGPGDAPQPLRALTPPGPGPSTLLPSFLPTETYLDGSQLGGSLVHLGSCRDFSNQRFLSLLQSVLTPGGHTPRVSCWALPSTPLHGHQPVHCFPAPAATYLPVLLESSDLRALLLLTFPQAP